MLEAACFTRTITTTATTARTTAAAAMVTQTLKMRGKEINVIRNKVENKNR